MGVDICHEYSPVENQMPHSPEASRDKERVSFWQTETYSTGF